MLLVQHKLSFISFSVLQNRYNRQNTFEKDKRSESLLQSENIGIIKVGRYTERNGLWNTRF